MRNQLAHFQRSRRWVVRRYPSLTLSLPTPPDFDWPQFFAALEAVAVVTVAVRPGNRTAGLIDAIGKIIRPETKS